MIFSIIRRTYLSRFSFPNIIFQILRFVTRKFYRIQISSLDTCRYSTPFVHGERAMLPYGILESVEIFMRAVSVY